MWLYYQGILQSISRLLLIAGFYNIPRISKDTKEEPNFWTRIKWFFGICGIATFIAWSYSALAIGLSNIRQEYQWILISLVPILREVCVWTVLKACFKATDGLLPNKMTINHYWETRHAVFTAIILGGIATPESSYCLIAIDFLINLYRGWRIVKKSKAGVDGW